MANSKVVGIRIPDELLKKIDRLAEKEYTSHRGIPNRSSVVLDIISAHFDTLLNTVEVEDAISLPDNVSTARFNKLQDEFNKLEGTVNTLSNSVRQLMEDRQSTHVEATKTVQNQLPIFPVLDSVAEVSPIDKSSLTVGELAQRFGMEPRNLGSRKSQFEKKGQLAEFVTWSREKDPDRYGWEYREGSKLYYRVESLVREGRSM